jgi:ribosomal protein S27AE
MTARKRTCPFCGSEQVVLIEDSDPQREMIWQDQAGQLYLGRLAEPATAPTHRCKRCAKSFLALQTTEAE